MTNLRSNLRLAVRMLRRSPVFTFVAILTLGLGIGANTAIFSVMNALLLRTLPVHNPGELVLLGEGRAQGIFTGFPGHDRVDLFSEPFYESLRSGTHAFTGIAAMESLRADEHGRVGSSSEALEPLRIRLVSGNYFDLLGVGAAEGRLLNASDDANPGGQPVAVMSYAFRERRFGHNAGVVGRTVSLNGRAFTVVGVAAAGFFGTVVGESLDFWMPLALQPQVQPWFPNPRQDMMQSLYLIGRRAPGVSMTAAAAETNGMYRQFLRQAAGPSPSAERLSGIEETRLTLTSAARGISQLRREFSRPLQILMVLVGLVLLIACVNIANLLLARASGRRREMAVRLALGAGRRILMGQLLTESVLLGLAGGAVGVWLAWWGAQALLLMGSAGPNPIPLAVSPDAAVLSFTFGLSLLTGLLFGIAPAVQLSRTDPGPALKEGKGAASRRGSRLGRLLVCAQTALALFLMIGAGLFLRTLQKLEQADTGFRKDGVLRVALDTDTGSFHGPAQLSSLDRLRDRIRALPGVTAAGYAMLAYNDGMWVMPLWPEGVPHTEANARSFAGNRVGNEFFAAMGIPLSAGRAFNANDTPHSQHVIIVNESLARTLFPHGPAVGHRLSLQSRDGYDFEIVGVVRDSRLLSVREKAQPAWYVSAAQEADLGAYGDLVIRTAADPATIIPVIRSVVHEEDPNLAIAEIATMRALVDQSLGTEHLLAQLAAFFGTLALLLAAVGLYGVMASSVESRTGEIGIRIALGAMPRVVLQMVLRESMMLVTAGLAAGIIGAVTCARLVASQLYEVPARDPWTIGAASAALLGVALVAAWLPARRAANVDPMLALRDE